MLYLTKPHGRSFVKLVDVRVLNSPSAITFMLHTRYKLLLQRTRRKLSIAQKRQIGGMAQIIKEEITLLPRPPMR